MFFQPKNSAERLHRVAIVFLLGEKKRSDWCPHMELHIFLTAAFSEIQSFSAMWQTHGSSCEFLCKVTFPGDVQIKRTPRKKKKERQKKKPNKKQKETLSQPTREQRRHENEVRLDTKWERHAKMSATVSPSADKTPATLFEIDAVVKARRREGGGLKCQTS